MATVKEVFAYLCEIAPLELQMEFDNSGFLLGRENAQVSRVLLALDITDAVIEEAIEKKAELLVSHHPLIWDAPKAITDAHPYPARILKLAENKIAVISMHTNLDTAAGGVNDVLISQFCSKAEEELIGGCGRIGKLEKPMPMSEFLSLCKEKLNVKGLRYYDSGKPVSCLGVLGGGGSDFMNEAFEKGCDTYLTADIKYHQFLDAAELGLNLIDGDHFYTENPVMPVVCEKLRDAFPELDVFVSERHHAVIEFA